MYLFTIFNSFQIGYKILLRFMIFVKIRTSLLCEFALSHNRFYKLIFEHQSYHMHVLRYKRNPSSIIQDLFGLFGKRRTYPSDEKSLFCKMLYTETI